MSDTKAFRHAVAAIVVDNRRLIAHVGQVWNYFVQGEDHPPAVVRLSEALKCESNGAHRLLEKLNQEIKKLGRPNLPRRPIEGWLALSSRRLLNELLELAMHLDAAFYAQSDALRHAVNCAMTKEDAFTNFLLGESGGDADMSQECWKLRLDKFIRDLKDCFNKIVVAVDDVEVAIDRHRSCKPSKRKPRCQTSHRPGWEVMRKDIAAIRKEVHRREQFKTSRGIATSARNELELLYRDEAWFRRCRQWKFPTLYTYIIR